MRMEFDTLDYATGEVLLIKCENGQWRPVAYLSKSLNKTERNYKIYNKKMLAIISGLENWRHLLEETKFKFEVWTNHKNLEYFMKTHIVITTSYSINVYLVFDITWTYVRVYFILKASITVWGTVWYYIRRMQGAVIMSQECFLRNTLTIPHSL